MRIVFTLIILVLAFQVNAQDKIYLRDNSVVEGKILQVKEKNVFISQKNEEAVKVPVDKVALIIYEDGHSEVMPKEDKELSNALERDWMIGTNILQPLSGYAGLIVEKKISKRYSLRVGQSLYLGMNYGLEWNSSFLNNLYFGKGRLKWFVSGGLNLTYFENRYYPFLMDDLAVMDYFAPYPPDGFISGMDISFTAGTGFYVDVTRHMGLGVQLQGMIEPSNWGWYKDFDIYNTGFMFYYKF